MISRRGLLGGLLAAPVIIRTPGLLMAVKPLAAPQGPVVYRISGYDQYGHEVEEYVRLIDQWQSQREDISRTKWNVLQEAVALDGAAERQETLLRMHDQERRLAESFRRIT